MTGGGPWWSTAVCTIGSPTPGTPPPPCAHRCRRLEAAHHANSVMKAATLPVSPQTTTDASASILLKPLAYGDHGGLCVVAVGRASGAPAGRWRGMDSHPGPDDLSTRPHNGLDLRREGMPARASSPPRNATHARREVEIRRSRTQPRRRAPPRRSSPCGKVLAAMQLGKPTRAGRVLEDVPNQHQAADVQRGLGLQVA